MNVQNLLVQVSAINKKYEGIAEITGENYNIFKILGLTTNEVRTHSAFIAELLKPNGTHGQKDSFLRAFIQELKLNGFDDIDKIDAEVLVEENIGDIPEDYASGGRIDIVIKARNGKIIVIENKIYARDQTKQLIRYHNKYRDAYLLYLTLNGKEPDALSIQDIDGKQLESGKDYKCISYKIDILNWLKTCKEKAVNHPILRETITQYINLIKHLTNQTMNDDMKKEIVESIANNRDYIEAAKEISNNWDAVRMQIMQRLIQRLKSDIENDAGKVGLNIGFDANLGLEETEFYFFKDNWKNWIYFSFDKDFTDLTIGIYPNPNTVKNDIKFEIDLELRKLIHHQLSNLNFGNLHDLSKANWSSSLWYWLAAFDEWKKTDLKDVNERMPKAIFEAVNGIQKAIEIYL